MWKPWKIITFRKVYHKITELENSIRSMKNLLRDIEDMKFDRKSKQEKDNKIIVSLEAENRMLKNELIKKNQFIEGLLLQLLGGANIKNILASSIEKEPIKLSSTMSAREAYLAKKNGEATKSRLP